MRDVKSACRPDTVRSCVYQTPPAWGALGASRRRSCSLGDGKGASRDASAALGMQKERSRACSRPRQWAGARAPAPPRRRPLRGICSCAFDLWSAALSVPESGYVHAAIAVIDAVDDPVGADDDLANGWIVELRHDAAQLGKVGQAFGVADEELAESDRAFRRIQRDVNAPRRGGRVAPKARGLPDNP